MQTKDMPHGTVGFRFARALLDGECDKVHSMLSTDLKLEYLAQQLKQAFEKMISRSHPVNLPDVEVMDNGESGDLWLDDRAWPYLAIWTESVTATARPFGTEHLIVGLIWGRS